MRKPLNLSPLSFFFIPYPPPHPPPPLKVPAASLPSFQRMTPSPMTPATPTAAAVKATMSTRRRSCWMSPWKGQPALLTPTARPRLLAPCSGLLETLRARGQQEVLPPAPQHQLVRGALFVCEILL